jgi:putative ABC transport system substrate-binding protein
LADLAVRAQQVAKIPRIGIIGDEPLWDNFRQALRDLGYIENQNIAIEYRSSEGKVDRLAQAARELISVPVNIIVGLTADLGTSTRCR